MSQYLSIQEAANALQVDYKVVYRLVREGRIPSARVGWQFRITQADLNAYLNAERTKQAANARELSAPLDEGASLPAKPPRARNGARNGAGSGAGGGAISKTMARRLERSFIARFDEKVASVATILHPATGKLLRIGDWQALRVEEEELEELMVALNTAFLDWQTLESAPHNTRVRYTVEETPDLVIEARVLTRLAAFCRAGFDGEPMGRSALAEVMDAQAREAQQAVATVANVANVANVAAVTVVGLASPTGWADDAVAEVRGGGSRAGGGGAGAHVILVDLRRETLDFDPDDDVAARFAALFEPTAAADTPLALREGLRAEVDEKGGVMLREFTQRCGVDEATVAEAAKALVAAAGATYRLVPDKAGQILVRA